MSKLKQRHIAVYFNEKITLYESHHDCWFLRIFGPTPFTFITCALSKNELLKETRKELFGSANLIQYTTMVECNHENS